MTGHLRVKSPWSQFGVFLALFGSGMVLSVVVSGVVMMASGFTKMAGEPINWSLPGFASTMKVLQAISSVLIFFLPAFVFAMVVFTKKPFYYLGLRPAQKPQMYLLAVVCMLAAFPLVSLLGEINASLPLPEWMVKMEKDASKQLGAFLKADNALQIIINLFVMAFLPAVCEEICFRGALQRIMIGMFRNPWTGIIITAILFSALHMQFLGFLPRMFLGIALGVIYWYSGSLWPGILAHMAYNGVQVIGVSFAPEYIEKNPSIPIYFSIASLLIVCTTLWTLKTYSTTTYAKEYESDELNANNQFLA